MLPFLCSLLMPYWTSLCVLRRTRRQGSLYETLFHCNTLSKHYHQVALRLGRIVQDLKLSGSGLVTPIEVERYSNGARILFVPKDSTYASSKDEKNKKEQEAKNFPEKTILNKPRTQGYVSPEQEAENDRREEVR
jgi:hypothetical protein